MQKKKKKKRCLAYLDGRVLTASNDLRIDRAGDYGPHGARMPVQHVNLRFRAHIPNPRYGIPATRHEHVQRRVQL